MDAFWLSLLMIFLAELGDKAMFGTFTLATTNPFIPVWIGSTLGTVLSDALAIGLGMVLGKSLPKHIVRTGAAIVFFAFGAFMMYRNGTDFGIAVWVLSLAAIALAGVLFLGKAFSGKR